MMAMNKSAGGEQANLTCADRVGGAGSVTVENPWLFVFDPPLPAQAIFRRMSHESSRQSWMICRLRCCWARWRSRRLLAANWWSRHYTKVSLGLGAITLGYYLLGLQASARVWHTAHDYISFIALIVRSLSFPVAFTSTSKAKPRRWPRHFFVLRRDGRQFPGHNRRGHAC